MSNLKKGSIMKKDDVIIIGNSVIALSIAYVLIQQDKNIKLRIIGPFENIGSASYAAGAMINCFAEITHKTLQSEPGKEKFALAYKALKRWDSWVEELNTNIEDKHKKLELTKGTYVLLNSESGELDSYNYNAMMMALSDYNEPYEEVKEIRDIPGINPIPNLRPLHAIYLPNEHSIDSNFYLQQLTAILLKNKNITFTNGVVKKIITEANSIESVLLANGEKLSAAKYILANGAYAQNIIDQMPELEATMPKIIAGLGISMLLEQDKNNPIKHVLRTPNRSGACGLHALPRKDSLYIGATNNAYMVPSEKLKAGLTKFLLNCAIEQLNQNLYSSNIEGYHVGNRPVSFDGFPMIGKTAINDLWIVNGTYRDGFHQSPIIAEMIAKDIIHNEEYRGIFAPQRKLLRSMTKQESLDEFMLHHTAAIFEHSTKLPGIMTVQEFEKMVRVKMNMIYDKLDIDYGLIPEILFMIDFESNQDKLIQEIKGYLKRSI